MKTFKQYNESIKDKMTPISPDVITKNLVNLTGLELGSYIDKSLKEGDNKTVELLIKHGDFSTLSTSESSIRDKMTPKSEEEISNAKNDIINYIIHVVMVNGGYIDMLELVAESAPVIYKAEGSKETDIKPKKDVVHIIRTLYMDDVDVEKYETWNEEVLDNYRVKYEDLSPYTLLELKELLEDQTVDDELVNNESVKNMTHEFEILEGSETTSVVGSGTMVGGGPVGSYTKASGQAVGGGDSPSSMSSNSNDTSADKLSSRSAFIPKKIMEVSRKKKKNIYNKNKKDRVYNQIGAEIDKLYLKKKKNETMKTWKEFNKIDEGYLSIGNAVKVTYPDHEDVDKIGIITDRNGDFLTVDMGTHTIKINASSIVDLGIKDVSEGSETTDILNEDDGGGGADTLGNTSGMGAIVSAQPSAIPGDVQGSTKGSGDIGCTLGTYGKQPAGIFPKQGKKRRRKFRDSVPSNPVIDNFYVTNYKESTNGNVIQKWDAFRDTN